MTSDDAAAQGGGVTAGTTGPLPFDTSAAHQARPTVSGKGHGGLAAFSV